MSVCVYVSMFVCMYKCIRSMYVCLEVIDQLAEVVYRHLYIFVLVCMHAIGYPQPCF